MKEKDYLKLKAKIEAEYRQNIEALNRIWAMAGDKPKNPQVALETTKSLLGDLLGAATAADTGSSKAPRNASGLAQCVRSFVEIAAGPFTILDVEGVVIQSIPEAKRLSIAAAIKRLVKNEKIIIEKQGSGRRPSIYKKA